MDPKGLAAFKELCGRPAEMKAAQTEGVFTAFKESTTRLEAARLLRNACAQNAEVKSEVLELFHGVRNNVVQCLLLPQDNQDNLTLLRVVLQFLSNLVHDDERARGHSHFLVPYLQNLLESEDFKVVNFTSSVLLQFVKLNSPECYSIEVVSGLCSAVTRDCEFALFAVQNMLMHSEVCPRQYFEKLRVPDKLTFFEIFSCTVEKLPEDTLLRLLKYFIRYYKQQAAQILTTMKNDSIKLEPTEFTSLLALFCELSGQDRSRCVFQSDKSLLIDTVYLLRMIHEAGKSAENMFAPVRRLTSSDQTEIEQHPAYGFKRDLIRLLGNLCWDHDANKNEVRELEGIPLLLDCTTLDGKNPLMTEWVVVTLRALCKNNPKNQEVVSQVDNKGLVSVELAKEYGVEAAVKARSNATPDPEK